MSERGIIRSEKYARQQVRWPSMRWGNITPTDIDGALDFGDKLYIFFEVKHISSHLNTGQRLLLERLCHRINKSGAVSVALVAQHYNDHEHVILEKCILDEYWYLGEWQKPKGIITIEDCVDKLHIKHVKPL